MSEGFIISNVRNLVEKTTEMTTASPAQIYHGNKPLTREQALAYLTDPKTDSNLNTAAIERYGEDDGPYMVDLIRNIADKVLSGGLQLPNEGESPTRLIVDLYVESNGGEN